MKKLFLFAIFLSNSVFAATITACYEDTDGFPYAIGNSTEVPKNNPGISPEIIDLVAEKLGIKVNYTRAPWKRCLDFLKEGVVDLLFNASFKEERLQFGAYPMKDGQVDPSKRITTRSYSIYALNIRSFSWNGKKIENMTGLMGVQRGYSIIEKLKEMNLKIKEISSLLEGFKKLDTSRIDAFTALTVSGDGFLINNSYPNIEKLLPPITTKPYYVMLSHQFIENNPNIAENFWLELKNIRESHFDKIAAKYYNKE